MLQLNPRVKEVAEAIEESGPEDRRQWLSILPRLLGISAEDFDWLKLSESAFAFWKNEENAIYDELQSKDRSVKIRRWMRCLP
ncbi:MAG TPA: hypothetical protein EYP49_12635 [Anaerolineae bacterium]|nr:hypothetical protein [Anaerolineae bacterium]